jgi:metal-responsive CopG/Arc/MetJ family transcriptional regulator
MRTTIELSDDLISALRAISVKKGYRGYSKVIEEALNFYLKENEKKRKGREKVLRMKGSWSLREAKETKKKLEELRKNWKI